MLIIDQVRWQATANISRFREFLNYPLNENQRGQLQTLRSREGKPPQARPPKTSEKSGI